MNIKKIGCLMLAVCTIATSAIGCGSSSSSTSTTEASDSVAAASTAAAESSTAFEYDKSYAVKFAVPADSVASATILEQKKEVEDAGQKIEFVTIAGGGQDYINKINVSLMAGDEIDLIRGNTLFNFNFDKAQLLTDLSGVAAQAGIDMDKVFGSNVVKQDGKILAVPITKDQWVTLYNKKIFDDAIKSIKEKSDAAIKEDN